MDRLSLGQLLWTTKRPHIPQIITDTNKNTIFIPIRKNQCRGWVQQKIFWYVGSKQHNRQKWAASVQLALSFSAHQKLRLHFPRGAATVEVDNGNGRSFSKRLAATCKANSAKWIPPSRQRPGLFLLQFFFYSFCIAPSAETEFKHNMENESKYLPELLAEKDSLDTSFTHAMKLLSAGKMSVWTSSTRGFAFGGQCFFVGRVNKARHGWIVCAWIGPGVHTLAR